MLIHFFFYILHVKISNLVKVYSLSLAITDYCVSLSFVLVFATDLKSVYFSGVD